MRGRVVISSFNTPSREYEFDNEVRFRSEVNREITELKGIIASLQDMSDSSISKSAIRKNMPSFRASVVDY